MAFIRTWLDFALQQVAAESYIDRARSGELGLVSVLKIGNNNISGDQSGMDALPGKTRMTTLQAQYFTQRYQIIDHHANDATGFSATLMFDTQTNSYTLSFRSTESAPATQGGDRERDLLGADAEVGASGFAFGQLAAMEEYYQSIKASEKLPAGAVLNVTGFSLGGHLATVFTELHASEVNHTYIFNGAGRGHVSGAVPGLSAEENRIQDMLIYFRSVLENPDNASASFPRTSVYDQAKTLYDAQGTSWHPFDQGTTNLYNDVRYQWAKAATQELFGPIGLAFLQSPGEVQDQGPFAKITQLYGQATTDDLQFVANSGVHAPTIPVFIEGQPLIAGLPIPSITESANTHSITLIVDSLAVQEMIQTIDSRYGQARAELLIKASSNSKADTVAPLDTLGVVEGDSLEKTVDAFRKLFRDPGLIDTAPLPINSRVGGFGDLANRNSIYGAIQEITDRVVSLQARGIVLTITDLTDPGLDHATLLTRADPDTAEGVAYRYALKELNPFAVTTNTESGTNALYAPFNAEGGLNLYNAETGKGTLTAYYLEDRAAFLKEKVALNQTDQQNSSDNIHFKDFALNGLEITTTADLRVDQEFLFGSDGDEGIGILVGNSKADHLYGGGGNDLLEGGDGRDYLQGDAGIDRLDIGAGADTMAGGADNDFYIVDDPRDQVFEGFNNGTDRVESSISFTLGVNVDRLTLTGTADIDGTGNELNNEIIGNGGINRLEGKAGTDHLIGGDQNDVLIGGSGDNDLLEGGTGFDTYIYNTGDGTDRIEDLDADGVIFVDGQMLVGGVKTAGHTDWTSSDGTIKYVMSGTDLVVMLNDQIVLTVNENFQSGQFGIRLIDEPESPLYDDGRPFKTIMAPDTLEPLDNDHNYIFTATPDWGPVIELVSGNDQIYSQRLSALIAGGYGHDRIYGGEEADQISGGNYNSIYDLPGLTDGDDVIEGRGGADEIEGDAGDDRIYGGDGNDQLFGDIGNFGFFDPPPGGDDLLDGGTGDDVIRGDYGADILLGGEGNDILAGDYTAHYRRGQPTEPGFVFDTTRAKDDFLDGGEDNDQLYGDGGDDSLVGGRGNDFLYGDYGEQIFLAVDNDLSEISGNDILNGGAGNDFLYGMGGDDVLAGGDGVDSLFGDFDTQRWPTARVFGNDVINAGDGNDHASGGGGDDMLLGGLGHDILWGDSDFHDPNAVGSDTLDGEEGDDILLGGAGDDRLDGGDGNDVLFGTSDFEINAADQDVLDGGAGADWLFGEGGGDVIFGGEGGDILLGDDYFPGPYSTFSIALYQGSSRIRSTTPGDDVLDGGAGDDYLAGQKGNDTLQGGNGFDTYFFELGDRHDTIADMGRSGEGNSIQFGAGISLESLVFLHDALQQTLTIQVGGGDSIMLLGFDPNAANYVVRTLSFLDGLQVSLADQLPLPGGLLEGSDEDDVIGSGSGDDTIFAENGNDVVNTGAGNDRIVGGRGNDSLAGGQGQDTYVFNPGDGSDYVVDISGEGNRLLFGLGISAASIALDVVGEGALAIRPGTAGDSIQILDNLERGDLPFVDVLQFADGTTLSIEALLAQGVELVGTAGADILTGTVLVDRISGGAGDDVIRAGVGADMVHGDEGNDYLYGDAGNDLLDGGTGSDVLDGGGGEDTYVFGRGAGSDILQDSPVEQSGPNTVRLTQDVTPQDLRLQTRLSHHGTNIVLTIVGTQDELTLPGADDPRQLPISRILFADGTSWDTAEILNRVEGVRVTASSTGSSLHGTSYRDELVGGVGNDELDGQGGADRMIGGAGDDAYWVEHSGDVVVEAADEGVDTVLSLIDYTLPAHVENLFLRTTAQPVTDPVHGEGNTSSNRLLGNFVSNVLIGGAGDDFLWGGYSIGEEYGPGDDDLYGGSGSDTYFIEGSFNGVDTIHDVALAGEGNRLQLGNTVRPDDVVFVQDGTALRMTTRGGLHGAVLMEFDPDGLTGSLVTEVVAFSGGVEDVTGGYETTLLAMMNPTVGTENADMLTGTGNAEVIKASGGDDVIAGGIGNDVLIGGTGNDTYIFNQGDGFDLIDDQQGESDINTVQFGVGISSDMLRVVYGGTFGAGGLSVRIGTSGDGLHFLSVSADDPTDSHAIDVFRFTNGAQLTFAELFGREVLVQGTGGSDGELFGTVADDLMVGLGGSDTLLSGAGNDTLIGGTGNDILDGGEGSDTYVFNPGDGIDTIQDDASPSDLNRLRFGNGITVSDLTLFDAGDGLTVNRVEIRTSGDVILLPNVIEATPALTVAEFADGVSIDLSALHAANQLTVGQLITGNGGEPVFLGGLGNDTIRAGTGATTILGLAGHDILIGSAAEDLLMGGRGNDRLQGGAGNDTYLFNLGDGMDTLTDVATATATATAGAGNRIRFGAGITLNDLTLTQDQVARTLTIQVGSNATDKLVLMNFDPSAAQGSLVVDTLAFESGSEVSLVSLLGPAITFFGTSNDEALVGTSGNDGIDAGDGNDTVYGNGGNDLVLAGEGNDVVSGDEGSDTVAGGSGADYLYGGDGDDVLTGEAGNDVLVGDRGNDTLLGGIGNDVLNSGAGADQLAGGQGDDTLYIDAADTDVTGGPGYDTVIVVGTDAVTLTVTVAEVEVVAGSSGDDVLAAVGSTTGVTLYGGGGDDRLTGGEGNDVLVGQTGGDTLAGDLGADVLNGAEGEDVLIGDAGNDTMYGGTGDDQIIGGDGDDSGSGDEGADTILGGTGTDYLYGGDGDDVLNGQADNDVLVGDAGNDILSGSTGNDVLNGSMGADRLAGEDGDDTLYIDAADTQVSGGMGFDVVTVVGTEAVILDATVAEVEFVAGNSGDDVFTAIGSVNGVTFHGGGGNDHLLGGQGDDVLVGQEGLDTLTGGIGNDILNGGDGDDVLSGEVGNDTVYAGAGDDLISGGEGVDSVNGDEGVDLMFGDGGDDYLFGGEGDDLLNGEEGHDVLVGQLGNDTLSGGLGNDYLAGGTGDDQYVFDRGDGSDTISEDDMTLGNQDSLQFGAGIDPLDLVISRQANDLRLAIHGTSEQMTIENWYLGEGHQVEAVQAGDGAVLLNSQVDQLIQAMAAFTEQHSLTWDQAIDQRPQDVQAVLAASWQ